MTVKVFLKNGNSFSGEKDAVFDDRECGCVIISCGILAGDKTPLSGKDREHYHYDDYGHVAISWRDVKKIEVTTEG